MYPFKIYTAEELLKDFEKLCNNKKRAGYACSNAFFQYERLNTPSQNKPSCRDWYAYPRSKLLVKQISNKYDRDEYSIINFMNHPPSQFCPAKAREIYQTFNAKNVFDPFAGWGDRCIAAMSLGINYIGVDSNINLKIPFNEMIQYFAPYSKSKVHMIFQSVENTFDEVDFFDFVFSSPPFWNKKGRILEKYHNMNSMDLEGFCSNVMVPVLNFCMARCKYSCFYIPDHMAEYIAHKHGILPTKHTISWSGAGNKKFQIYTIYIYEGLS